jgi:biotin carboxyl carrier protein
LSVTLPAPELPPGPRSALVIATSTYQDASLRKLRAPAEDAANLVGVLGDPNLGGFTVTEVSDSAVHQLRIAMEDFLAGRKKDETVLVYLSCHGLLTPRRRLYLAASDTDRTRLAATGIEARWLIDCLDECSARRQIVILDCCFSGAFALTKGPADVGLDERFGEAGEAGHGRIVLTASRATEYSFEGETPIAGGVAGSVFTSALVNGLSTGDADQDRDGLVSVLEAYDYTYAQVRKSGSAQTPQRWLYGGEGRDVVLARSPTGITIEPAVLHDEMRIGLESRYPQLRIGAVNTLAEWLADRDPARVAAARQVLEEIADQDIPLVAQVARAHLDSYPAYLARHAESPANAELATAAARDRVDTSSASPTEVQVAMGTAWPSSDSVAVVMPRLNERIASGTVSRWLKRLNDPVKAGEGLAEISTNEGETRIPSPVTGFLFHIYISRGTAVASGGVLALVKEGEPPVPKPADSLPYVTPLVNKLALENGVDLASIYGTGVGGRIRKDDVLTAARAMRLSGPVTLKLSSADIKFTYQELKVLRWLKQENEIVKIFEPLVEIDGYFNDRRTGSARILITSPMAGELRKIIAPSGEEVGVGSKLAIIARQILPG